MIKFKKVSKGQTFGLLTTIKILKEADGLIAWECQCECGKICIAIDANLLSGFKQSCGCVRKAKIDAEWIERKKKWKVFTSERLPTNVFLWLVLIRSKYGLSHKDWTKLVLRSNGYCEMCNKPFKNARQCCIDHDHKTGKVRGLLCTGCNLKLGLLESFGSIANFLTVVQKYLSKKF
jgi:recombination endonuclease VII